MIRRLTISLLMSACLLEASLVQASEKQEFENFLREAWQPLLQEFQTYSCRYLVKSEAVGEVEMKLSTQYFEQTYDIPLRKLTFVRKVPSAGLTVFDEWNKSGTIDVTQWGAPEIHIANKSYAAILKQSDNFELRSLKPLEGKFSRFAFDCPLEMTVHPDFSAMINQGLLAFVSFKDGQWDKLPVKILRLESFEQDDFKTFLAYHIDLENQRCVALQLDHGDDKPYETRENFYDKSKPHEPVEIQRTNHLASFKNTTFIRDFNREKPDSSQFFLTYYGISEPAGLTDRRARWWILFVTLGIILIAFDFFRRRSIKSQ